jgi:APA family basic amino acid/polyamine antiporter
LQKSLGLFDATMIVAGSMIGSGIFIVSADMSRTIGSPGILLLLWLITGLVTVVAALSYGELAGMMPKAGGQYVYIQKAYGSLIGFLYGWTVFMVIQTGVIAAVAVAFAKFTSVFIPSLSTNNILFSVGPKDISAAQLLAICCIVFLTAISCTGIKNGKLIQRIFTSTKLLALLALIVIGIAVGLNSDAIAQNFSNMWQASSTTNNNGVVSQVSLTGFALLAAMGVAMVGSLFSSDAWNNVTFIAGEIREPKKNIPRSLFFGTLIVTILYILANVAYLCLLPLHGDPAGSDVASRGIQFATDDRVGTAAASMIFGNAAVYMMAALIMISTFGCNNGLILSGARVYYAMAKDGLFFRKAAELNKKGVPQFGLIVQCIWASLLCVSGTYGNLLDYATFASLMFYIITIGGLFILRKKEPDTERPYKAFGYPIIPSIYIIVALAICIDLLIYKPEFTWPGLIIVLLGVPFYFLQRRNVTE